jgi:hypothetical protein
MEFGTPSGEAEMALAWCRTAYPNRVGQGVLPHPLTPLKCGSQGARALSSMQTLSNG